MKTTYASTEQNVSNNERGFRAVTALGMLTAVISGAVASPAAIAALSMISIYLVMTAMISIDPVYHVTYRVLNNTSYSGYDKTQIYA